MLSVIQFYQKHNFTGGTKPLNTYDRKSAADLFYSLNIWRTWYSKIVVTVTSLGGGVLLFLVNILRWFIQTGKQSKTQEQLMHLDDDKRLSHRTIFVNKFETTNVIEQPPHSPDFAMCDFLIFPKLKFPLYGTKK